MPTGATLEPRIYDPARLARILEASDVGLWEFDHTSQTTRWSPQVEAMLGRRTQTLGDLPEGWLGLIHPDDRPHVEAAMEAAVVSDNPLFDQQYRMQHQDGRWRWLHARGRVLERDPVTGMAACTAGTVTDITEAKELERQLAERERRLSLITENIGEVFWMADVSIDTTEYASPAYEQIWQRPVTELYARPRSFLEAVHPEDAQNVARTFLYKDEALPFDHEYRIVRPDSSVRWIWERGFPINDSAGKATHYVGVAQDITERKTAEEEIRRLNEQLRGHVDATADALAQSQEAHRESEERFRYAMEASQVGLWEWDLVCETVEFDAAHAASLCRSHPDRACVWADVVHPDDLPALAAAARQLRADGHCEIEYRLRQNDGGERWILSRGKVIKRGPASEPSLALGTHTDIDALKRAQAQRRRLAAIVEAAGDLIAIASPGGEIEYVNSAGRALLGIAPEASLVHARIEHYHPDWAAKRVLDGGLREAARRGQWLGETAMLRADGSEFPVSQLIIAQRNNTTGHVESYATICRDLREHKAIEATLREREQVLQAVLDNFPFRVWLKDCDSRYLAVNRAFAHTFGFPCPESLIGRSDRDVTSADLAESYREDDRRVVAAGSPKQIEELGEVAGERRWFETYKSPVSVDGRVIGTVGFARDISDRKTAEIALRESETRLRAILEQLPVGVGVMDPHGTYLLSNAEMRQFVAARVRSRDAQQIPRWSARDALGHPIAPSQWPGARALRGEAVSPGIEFTYRRGEGEGEGEGEERLVLVSAVPFRDTQGELVGAISVVQDITDRKRAEAKVRESETLLKAVLNGNPDPIYLKDRGSRLLLANPAVFAIIGKPADACLGRTDEQLYDNPADGRAIMANDQRIMASGQAETVEEVVNTPAGPRYYFSKKAPYRDEAGNIVGLIGNSRDITERKKADAKLRESEALLKAVLEGSVDRIFLKDRDSRLLLANPATFAAIGKPPEFCLGKTARQIQGDPAEGQAIMDNDLRIMASGKTETVEEAITTPFGLRYYLSIKTPWRDAAGNIVGLIGTSRDITERKQTEAALIQARAQAEAANRAKSEFLAAASHDLRQPLMAISMFADTLAILATTERQRDLTGRLRNSVQGLGEMLGKLLNIAQLDAGAIEAHLAPVTTGQLIQWADMEIGPKFLDRRLRFKVRHPRQELGFETDLTLLKSILGNLFDNALKFCRRGGVLLAVRRRGPHLLIQVWDTGIGMAPEHLPRIFEEYFQVGNPARRRQDGVGLGLSIVLREAKLIGAQIACRSRLGRGSVFEVRLPACPDGKPAGLPSPLCEGTEDRALDALAGRSVVLVEDDGELAQATAEALGYLGMNTRIFRHAEAALASAEIAAADFYITDFRLPGSMDGIALLKAIEARRGGSIRALVVTGDAAVAAAQTVRSPRWPVLIKPTPLSTLLAALLQTATAERVG